MNTPKPPVRADGLRSDNGRAWAARYHKALSSHLRTARNGHRQAAATLGRSAAKAGVTTLDLVLLHTQSVLLLAPAIEPPRARLAALRRAGRFLAQALRLREVHRPSAGTRRAPISHRRHLAIITRLRQRLAAEMARRGTARERYRLLLLESRLAERNLRSLTRHLIAVQEEERKEISRELHDEVVQTLVGINVELSALTKGATLGLDTLKRKIARTQRLVKRSVATVHRFARDLRPAVLDHLGLMPALEAFVEKLAKRRRLKLTLTAVDGVDKLDILQRTILYRVAQEALTNVVRHAKATAVTVRLSLVPGALRMEISDDGKSFLVPPALLVRHPKRLGLIGMKERIEMLGGRFTIASTPGHGTTVSAEIPHPTTALLP
jgi:two-component system sensor histidine kinase DegS